MYSLEDYGAMIAHRERTAAYSEAVTRAVKPGDVVVEIGCGPGLFSLLASRAGAKRVYAMEASDSAAFARELVAANGCADRIEILHSSSRHVNLVGRANVIISDIRGVLPFLDDAIVSMEDARQRFLEPGGVMIPAEDTLRAALVSVPEFYTSIVSPWQDLPGGARLSPLLERALNSTYCVSFEGDKLISEPHDWSRLDYQHGAPIRAAGELQFHTLRSGVAHGVCLWFTTNLYAGIGYSTAPGQANNVYGQLFLPWLEPVGVEEGQVVLVNLRADPVGGSYVWKWDARVPAADGGRERLFSQSTLHSARFAPDALRRSALDFMPTLSPVGAAESWVLQHMDGTKSLQQLAHAVAAQFPELLRSPEEALELVSRLSGKFAL
jgi:ribosomal protein L11 methyltransferase PrmA